MVRTLIPGRGARSPGGVPPAVHRLALRVGQRLAGRDGFHRILARRAVDAVLDALDLVRGSPGGLAGSETAEQVALALARGRRQLELLAGCSRGSRREEVQRLLAGIAVVERAVAGLQASATAGRRTPGPGHG